MKKTNALRLVALTTLGVLMAVAQPALAAPGGFDDHVQAVRGVGSDTTYFTMQKLSDLYNGSPGCSLDVNVGGTTCLGTQPAGTVTTENYDHDEAQDAYPLGSGNGIKQVCGTLPSGGLQVDYARSSRDPQGGDCAGLTFRNYAKDAVAPEIFPSIGPGGSTGVTNLTKAQLVGIFVNCTITNWQQVGGRNQPIIPWGVQIGSGTYNTFKTYLGGEPNNCSSASHVIFENQAQPIAAAGADVQGNSIYFFSFGRFVSAPFTRAGGTLTDVDGVEASPSNILDNSFPISRKLYNAFKTSGSSQATVAFQNWICSATHAVDPETGRNFSGEITGAVNSTGFVRVAPCVDSTTGGT